MPKNSKKVAKINQKRFDFNKKVKKAVELSKEIDENKNVLANISKEL